MSCSRTQLSDAGEVQTHPFWSRVKHSTTEPLRSLREFDKQYENLFELFQNLFQHLFMSEISIIGIPSLCPALKRRGTYCLLWESHWRCCYTFLCARLSHEPSLHGSGLQIRVRIGKLFSLFLMQNICCGYSKEPSQ